MIEPSLFSLNFPTGLSRNVDGISNSQPSFTKVLERKLMLDFQEPVSRER